MAGTVPEADIKTRAMRNFAAEVLDKSGGNIKINVFPNGQLVLDKDMVTAIPAGMADLAQCQLGSFSGLVPEAAIMDLGMVFSNDDHWFAVANGKVGEIVTQKLAAKANSQFLCWMAQGPTSVWASTTKTIKTPDDMKGLKFRTPPSAYYVKAVGALGAAGTIISANELYTALQTNTVSATFCTSRTFNENKWFEVAPYVSRMVFAPQSSHSFIANMDSWKKLTPDAQKIIMTAAKNQEAWTRANSAADDAAYWKTIQDLKDSGKIKDLYVIPDPVVKQFIAIVMPSQIAAINADPNITKGVMDLVEAVRPK
jgi:tripartite ATP-independent transporter DctP family solute receptor